MIYAGLNVYIFANTQGIYYGKKYHWGEWKTVFKGAETVKNVQASNDALCAGKAIDTTERIYNFFQ